MYPVTNPNNRGTKQLTPAKKVTSPPSFAADTLFNRPRVGSGTIFVQTTYVLTTTVKTTRYENHQLWEPQP